MKEKILIMNLLLRLKAIKNMNEASMHRQQCLTVIKEMWSNVERITYVQRVTEKETVCYRTIYEEKKKKSTTQLFNDNFIKKIPNANQ